jgi:hypothetical protein
MNIRSSTYDNQVQLGNCTEQGGEFLRMDMLPLSARVRAYRAGSTLAGRVQHMPPEALVRLYREREHTFVDTWGEMFYIHALLIEKTGTEVEL